MVNVKIHLIGGEIITVTGLKEIKTILNPTKEKIYHKEDFANFLLCQTFPYTFVCDNSIFAIPGSNILYIEFSTN